MNWLSRGSGDVLDISKEAKNLSILELSKLWKINLQSNSSGRPRLDSNHSSDTDLENFNEGRGITTKRISSKIKLMILRLHYINRMTYSEISNQLMINYSSVRRIVRDYQSFQTELKELFKLSSI